VEQPVTIRQRVTRLPLRMLLIVATLIVIALIAAPMVDGMSDKDKANNVLLTGVPFILIFVAIVLTFIFLIVAIALRWNNRIPPRLHQTVEWLIIGGVVLGVVGMFQPWVLGGYQFGFLLLIVCFLAFNIWSHITPQRAPQIEKADKTH